MSTPARDIASPNTPTRSFASARSDSGVAVPSRRSIARPNTFMRLPAIFRSPSSGINGAGADGAAEVVGVGAAHGSELAEVHSFAPTPTPARTTTLAPIHHQVRGARRAGADGGVDGCAVAFSAAATSASRPAYS